VKENYPKFQGLKLKMENQVRGAGLRNFMHMINNV